MKFKRSSGILLHPTSLPGAYGIGDLGPAAYRWVDFLVKARCGLWQVLPLGPTGYGDSPYQCFSAFAGNPYLVSPELLLEEGLLRPEDMADRPRLPADRVDFGGIYNWKPALLDRSFDHFQESATQAMREELVAFQSEQAGWLDDYALFMALKDAHGGQPWASWEAALRSREPTTIAAAREKYALPIQRHIYRQFLFFRQWARLRKYAHQKNILIIGDVPIFVAHDSSDVWAHPELFFMDKKGQPTLVAGVPPDYFSATGQLWGNPLYNWKIHARTGYTWWIDRLNAVLNLVDIIRLDHFRGFAGYWEVPAGSPNAIKGRWAPGPGAPFFKAIKKALGDLPLIAEDLGEITPDVIALRDHFDLPGMKIFQFGFDGEPDHKFLPHNYLPNCVVYTGTHDNDTALGWFNRVQASERELCVRYLGCSGSEVAWDMMRAIWSSVAVFALAPMQDVLNLGNEARMNYPGRADGNWTWRMPMQAMSDEIAGRLRELNYIFNRKPVK